MDVQKILDETRKFDQEVDEAIRQQLNRDLSEYGLPPADGPKVRDWYRELTPRQKDFVDEFIRTGFNVRLAEQYCKLTNHWGYKYLRRKEVIETIKQRVQEHCLKLGITEEYILEKVLREVDNVVDAKSRDRLAALKFLAELKGMLSQEVEHSGEVKVKYVNDWQTTKAESE